MRVGGAARTALTPQRPARPGHSPAHIAPCPRRRGERRGQPNIWENNQWVLRFPPPRPPPPPERPGKANRPGPSISLRLGRTGASTSRRSSVNSVDTPRTALQRRVRTEKVVSTSTAGRDTPGGQRSEVSTSGSAVTTTSRGTVGAELLQQDGYYR